MFRWTKRDEAFFQKTLVMRLRYPNAQIVIFLAPTAVPAAPVKSLVLTFGP
jgi:hypothetical protein